jgi:preprotein translocase subunit SecE
VAFEMYKPGQGYWTRVCTAIGAGVIVLAGVAWLWRELAILGTHYDLYIQSGMAVVIIGGTGILLLWLLNMPRIVDFMIATEAEMRKVSWPTRRELMLSTWVVICGTLLMAILLFIFDLFFIYAFTHISVLEKGIQ